MILKMALSNIKKSYKDYAIYFLTLTLSIIMFFVVNSLNSEIAHKMFTDQAQIKFFEDAVGNVIIAITLALLFLVVYANQFIMKRRYKELALYTLFGLNKKKVISIITVETLIIGVISLIIGLGLGSLLSQFINHFAVGFFIKGESFELTFNSNVHLLTILVFSLIFLITILVNAFYVGKSRLIKLLQSDKKGEKLYRIKAWLSFVLLIISCGIFGYLYSILLSNLNFNSILNSLGYYIVIGIVNTFVFFYALSGIFIFFVGLSKKMYYKSLNLFTFNLLSQKLRTHFISLSIISLLLFFGISATTLSLSLNNSVADTIKSQFVNDVGVRFKKGESNFNEVIAKEKYGLEFKHRYEFKSVIQENSYIGDDYIAVSDFNRVTNSNLSLDKYEFAITATDGIEIPEQALKQVKTLTPDLQKGIPLKTNLDLGNGYVIVNDEYYQELSSDSESVFYAFNDPDKRFEETGLGSLDENTIMQENNGTEAYYKSALVKAVFLSQFMMVVAGIYLSSVLVLSGITMIAIQQLSSARDNIEKYRIVNYLGAGNNSIKRSVLFQVGIYFIVPIAFGILNSTVGMQFIANGFLKVSKINLMDYVLPIYAVIILGYLIYGYITYRAYYKVVNRSQRQDRI